MKIEYNIGDRVIALHPRFNHTVTGRITSILPRVDAEDAELYFVDGEVHSIGVRKMYLLCKID